MRTALFVDLI